MFEWKDNILCVQAGWLYGESGIMTKMCYDALSRGKVIQIKQRGCRGRAALVAYESMPERFKAAIEAKVGDPYRKVAENELLKYMEEDRDALKKLQEYRYGENGDKPLPSETVREYYADIRVMNAIGALLARRRATRSKTGRRSMADVWEKIASCVRDLPENLYPCKLPENPVRLKEKYKAYLEDGYTVFIHKGFGNSTAEKLNDRTKLWLLAQWANNVDRVTSERHLLDLYNEHAETQRKEGGDAMRIWKPLKSVNTLHNFLYSDGIRNLWWGSRYGGLKAKERYMYQHTTLMPTMRDSLWYSDGTKMNIYYRDDDGSVRTMSVYEVMDVYSEVFVGYAFCEQENYEAQRTAFRRALEFAGEKPYQVSFDNQGGHRKMESTSFLAKLAHVAINTKPYNGKSKTIESAFGRFQAMYLKRLWYFTGQNITAKREESRENTEYILANRESLPGKEEAQAAYLALREEWNRAAHPSTGQSRLEMYRTSRNGELSSIRREDFVELFCIEHKNPVRLTPYGLSFELGKKKHTYVVNKAGTRLPDVKWMAERVDHRYVVKYDPEDMTMIHLYDNTDRGLVYVATAEEKVAIHRGIQEREEWESSWFAEVNRDIRTVQIETRDRMEEILAGEKLLPEQHGLNSPVLKGIESSRSAKKRPENVHRKRKKERTKDIAGVEKEISNIVSLGGSEEEIDAVLDGFNAKHSENRIYERM